MSELTVNLWLMVAVAVSAVAFLYSSVGHGGVTGYLAVLALIGVAPDSARGTALLANCFVAGHRLVALPPSIYGILSGAVLIAAGLFLLTRRKATEAMSLRAPSIPLALVAGAGLGLVAGLTGIGGGVHRAEFPRRAGRFSPHSLT